MEEIKVNINIFGYLPIVLGVNEYLHKDIDDIYNENKLEFYKLYKEQSNNTQSKMFKSYTLIRQEYMKKVAGIIQSDYVNNTQYTYRLIKKGYKDVYNYFKTRSYIDIDDFSLYYMKKKKDFDNASEIEAVYGWIIILYLCENEHIPNNVNSCGLKEFVLKGLKELATNCFAYDKYFSDDIISKNKMKIDNIYTESSITQFKEKKLDILFDELIKQEIGVLASKGVKSDFHHMRKMAHQSGICKYIGALSGWTKVLGINTLDMLSQFTISKKDMDVVFYEYLMSCEQNKLNENDRDLFIISCLFIKMIIEEYQKVKDIYINNMQDEYYYEVNRIMEELEIEKLNIKNKKEKLNKDIEEIIASNNKLQEENLLLLKQLNKTKDELSTKENNNKEIIALREFLFELQQPLNVDEILNIESEYNTAMNYLKNKKYVIVGGSSIWNNKIKELFQNFIILSNEDINRDIKFLDNIEAVFINTNVLSHAFYYKIMSRLNKNNTKLFYLKGENNIKNNVINIYNMVKD